MVPLIDARCVSESMLVSGELSKGTARFGCARGFQPMFVCCGASAGISSSSSETACTDGDPVYARRLSP